MQCMGTLDCARGDVSGLLVLSDGGIISDGVVRANTNDFMSLCTYV